MSLNDRCDLVKPPAYYIDDRSRLLQQSFENMLLEVHIQCTFIPS